jgi:eukaryotic-like serine/threonine-protein kinase
MTLDCGILINQRYRVLDILGQGGMGSIYRAMDENLGVQVALKENLFTTEEFARQFRREAVILASLRHPNLPRVTDHFEIPGQGQYLVMDFIEGEDLRERLDRQGTLSDSEAVVLGTSICDALSYLHTRQPQVVHRDIKPGNVKITPAGTIILVDFGLAKMIEGSQATTTGARAMTPGYSPPEQYGTARTDHRSDIYSLGATLYVALTGVMPEEALARAMNQSELTPVRKHNPRVARKLANVVEKAMELHPEDRYQTAEELKKALINTRLVTDKSNTQTLTPPPPDSHISQSLEAIAVGRGLPNSGAQGASPNQTPPFQAGIPLADRSSALISKPPRRRITSCAAVFVLLVILLLGIGSLLVYFRPDLVKEAVSTANPLLLSVGIPAIWPNPTLTPSPTPSDMQSEILPSNAPSTSPSPTATQTSLPTQLVEKTTPAQPKPTIKPTTTPTPTMVPTPMGGGSGQIGYASDITGIPQVWLMNADGTARRQITDMPEGACQPAWSPDGKRIAFISPCSFNQEIYPGASLFIINFDGTELVGLPTVPGGDFDPAWSPDGASLLFTSLRDYNRAQIYRINLADNSVQSISANTVRDSQPAWSPDGKKIAFITTRFGPYQIWLMNPDGSDPELFSHSGSLKDTHPTWSPDGRVILFTQNEVLGGVPKLVAIRVEKGNLLENRVLQEIIPMREGAYSSDGTWIAYESWPDGSNHDIYIMTTNGLVKQRLTTDESLEFDPAWRPTNTSS